MHPICYSKCDNSKSYVEFVTTGSADVYHIVVTPCPPSIRYETSSVTGIDYYKPH